MKVIDYLKLAGAAAVVVLCGLAWFNYSSMKYELEVSETNNKIKEATIASLQSVNDNNAKTIEQLKQDAKANAEIVDRLSVTNRELAAKADNVRTVVKEVYRDDPASRDLAATPLTDGMRNALNAPHNR